MYITIPEPNSDTAQWYEGFPQESNLHDNAHTFGPLDTNDFILRPHLPLTSYEAELWKYYGNIALSAWPTTHWFKSAQMLAVNNNIVIDPSTAPDSLKRTVVNFTEGFDTTYTFMVEKDSFAFYKAVTYNKNDVSHTRYYDFKVIKSEDGYTITGEVSEKTTGTKTKIILNDVICPTKIRHTRSADFIGPTLTGLAREMVKELKTLQPADHFTSDIGAASLIDEISSHWSNWTTNIAEAQKNLKPSDQSRIVASAVKSTAERQHAA